MGAALLDHNQSSSSIYILVITFFPSSLTLLILSQTKYIKTWRPLNRGNNYRRNLNIKVAVSHKTLKKIVLLVKSIFRLLMKFY